MSTYAVTVDNIGYTYDGPSKLTAVETFRHYKQQILSSTDSGRGEAVVLWRDGEPIKEFRPICWEVTDTFAGEANYSWVSRGACLSLRQAIKAVRAYIPYARKSDEYYAGDGVTLVYKHSKVCRIAFIYC